MKARKAWLAFLAALLVLPLGHVYAGAPLRGIIAATISFTVSLAVLLTTVHVEGRGPFIVVAGLLLVAYLAVAVDAYRTARRAGEAYALERYNRWFVYLAVTVIVELGGGVVDAAVHRWVQAYKIPSASMRPTLDIGDHVLADKAAYREHAPERFDVVVFEYPKDPTKTLDKRVIGLPGETVEIRGKTVTIDGTKLDEPYAYFMDGASKPTADYGPTVVPEGSYFLLGDNRDQSYDSRFWGPVAEDKIWGRLKVVYFSWSAKGSHVRWDRIGEPIR